MPGLIDAADREAAWLALEPNPGYPPLFDDGVNGGHFDYVGARPKRLAQYPRQLHVYRARTEETREDSGHKQQTHTLIAVVLWPKAQIPEEADQAQAALDAALEALLDRIRGTLRDHTHGQRFWSAGESGGIGPSGVTGNIEVRMPEWRTLLGESDTLFGNTFVVEVVYPAVDMLVG